MIDLKICVASNYFIPRGYGGNAVYEPCKRLAKMGIEVHVVTSSLKGKPNYELMDGIHVHRVPTHFQKILNSEYPISPSALLSIYRVIRKYDVDLLHTHFLFSPMALSSGFLKFVGLIKIPLVVTSHGLTQGYTSLITELASKVLTVFSRRIVVKPSNALATVSMYEHNYFNNDFSGKLHYIPNGVDTSKFKPLSGRKALRESLGIKENEVLVLYFAQLRSAKGILTFLDAIRIVLSKSSNVKFLVAG